MDVVIYQPARNAMQSGRGKAGKWVLEPAEITARHVEPLMGWTAADGTNHQIRMTFATQEEAVSFAERKGWGFTVKEPRKRRVVPRNYSQRHRYVPPEE